MALGAISESTLFKKAREQYYGTILHLIRKRKDRLGQVVVLGDSHAAFFAGNYSFSSMTCYNSTELGPILHEKERDKRFCVLRLGPGLAYNTIRKNTSSMIHEKYELLNRVFLRGGGDTVVLSFGEIDIRTQVFKHTDATNNYKDVIDEILSNYRRFLNKVILDGHRVFVWGPIASQKDEWSENASFPRVGNEIDRNMATEYYNLALKDICDQDGIGFMSIYNDLVDNDYKTREEFIFDQCHLGQNARPLLEEQIKKSGLFRQ